jgi:hypothetical protein
MAFDAGRRRVVLFGGRAAGPTPFGDTWEWDGSDWQLMPAPVGPAPRSLHGLVYDAARGRCVLFGGEGASVLADTWEWDGSTWTQRFPATLPTAGSARSMAYDAARARIVRKELAGAFTWEWDGTDWTRFLAPSPAGDLAQNLVYDAARGRVSFLSNRGASDTLEVLEWTGGAWVPRPQVPAPPARAGYAAAHDPVRLRTVVFAGLRGSSTWLTDTWEWDGSAWSLRVPYTGPSLWSANLAQDVARGRTILCGAAGLGSLETWELEGSAWTLRSAAGPGVRADAAMAWDAGRGRAVLFGGRTFTALADTWEYDGTTWAQSTPPQSPVARWGSALVHDAARARSVLFGGFQDQPMGPLNDTWEWDGAAWVLRAPALNPPVRGLHAMAYDSDRGRTVLFGGSGLAGLLADTWEWDGTSWILLTPPSSPAARYAHSMTYDPVRRRTILLGGLGPFQLPGECWEWDGETWTFRALPAGPQPQFSAPLAFDPARVRAILYTSLFETWEYRIASDPVGPGHPGGGLAIACAPPLRPGATSCISFSDPPPVGAGLAFLLIAAGGPLVPPLPVPPPGVCAAAILHVLPQLVLQTTGDPAVFCVPLPAQPALAGQRFTAQGAALEIGVCLRATDALLMVVQP